jgi:uncharacterized protein
MRWDRGHRSDYVEDRRGQSVGGGGAGIGLLFLLFRWFGLPGVLIGLVVLGAINFCGTEGQQASSAGGPGVSAADDEMAAFVGFVLDDAQAAWTDQFAREGKRYRLAHLVLFSGRVDSACGRASAAVGPFYCPGDEKVYIDLSFYRALKERLGAPGDFAQAYVIAHEIGHHVQRQIGTIERGRDEGADGGSVRVELQADCFAGVWAHSTRRRDLLEAGDLEEALTAAEAIGDDTLQRKNDGTVRPETFSHGTSEQRARWFRRGLETGTMAACDTFSAGRL